MISGGIDFQQLFINVICIFLLTYSFIEISRNKNYRFPHISVFLIANIAANLSELFSVLYLSLASVPDNALLYVLQNGYNCAALVACAGWFMNSLQITNSWLYRKKRFIPVLLPFAAMAVLSLTSNLHHLIFCFDESGNYLRGALFTPFMSVAGIYILAALGLYVYADHNKEIFIFKGLNKIASVYSLFLFVCSAAQVVFKDALSLINIAAAIIALMIHEDLQRKAITIDSLTKLNNRNAINSHLLKMLRHQSRYGYAVMLDLDSFKSINDIHGHTEGDNALICVGEALRKVCTGSTFYGRLAGDEFMILFDNAGEDEVSAVEDKINKELKEILEAQNKNYRFTVSAGGCPVNEQMTTIPDVLKAADEKLYARKKEKKITR